LLEALALQRLPGWVPVIVITTTCIVLAAVRWPDRWQWRWQTAMALVSREQRERLKRELPQGPTENLGVWAAAQPRGSLPEHIRIGGLVTGGQLDAARAAVAVLPSETALERTRIASLTARIQLQATGVADYSVARREAGGIDDEDIRRAALAGIDLMNAIAVAAAGGAIRELRPPADLPNVDLTWADRIRIWLVRLFPATIFLAVVIPAYLLVSALQGLHPPDVPLPPPLGPA
jgi:hypothetical protein